MIVLDINPTIFSLGSIQIKWYGLSYVVGFLLGKVMQKQIVKNYDFDADVSKINCFFYNFDSILLLSVLIGGRLGYFIFYDQQNLLTDFYKIYQGGMSFHGALIAVLISTIIYSRIHAISYLIVSDIIVSVAPIGIFLGRITNFINQELYGKVISSKIPWATIFLHVDLLPRHPSQIYEALLEGILLFIVLYLYRKIFGLKRKGIATTIFVIGYSCFRIIVEYFRHSDQYSYIPLVTQGQLLSVVSILICFLTILFHKKRIKMVHETK